jgi:hypothetical protein
LYYFEESKAVQWPKPIASPTAPQAISDLISRILDGAPASRLFQVSINENLAVNGKDVFELSNGTEQGTISISASTGVAAAWGFNYYLKYVADSSCRIEYEIQFECNSFSYSLLVRKKYSNIWFEIISHK